MARPSGGTTGVSVGCVPRSARENLNLFFKNNFFLVAPRYLLPRGPLRLPARPALAGPPTPIRAPTSAPPTARGHWLDPTCWADRAGGVAPQFLIGLQFSSGDHFRPVGRAVSWSCATAADAPRCGGPCRSMTMACMPMYASTQLHWYWLLTGTVLTFNTINRYNLIDPDPDPDQVPKG
eukprot:SAG31_NODE_328_length_17643_cov_46.707649_13_plen_179_part_00